VGQRLLVANTRRNGPAVGLAIFNHRVCGHNWAGGACPPEPEFESEPECLLLVPHAVESDSLSQPLPLPER